MRTLSICVSGSDDYVADVVTTVVIYDDVGQSEYANVDDDVLAEQLLLSGDDDGESGMSASVVRVVHRVCMSEASSGDVGAVADCGYVCEAECATHAVVCDVDHVRCTCAVNAECRRNALHVLRLVLVLLLLMIFAGGAVGAVLIELFTTVGVPSKGISNNGTNFSSQLTQELLRRLKCRPVFARLGIRRRPDSSSGSTRRARTCCFTWCRGMVVGGVESFRRRETSAPA